MNPPDPHSPIPPEIRNSPEFYPFFYGALGAIGGTHIICISSAADRDATRNDKGVLTQNCLAACSFDLRFTYFSSGREATAGSTFFNEACLRDFDIPRGRYYLADDGFGSSEGLLIPYRGVSYHLSERICAKEA